MYEPFVDVAYDEEPLFQNHILNAIHFLRPSSTREHVELESISRAVGLKEDHARHKSLPQSLTESLTESLKESLEKPLQDSHEESERNNARAEYSCAWSRRY